MDHRRVLEGIAVVLRTEIQWKALPKERFGSPGSVRAYFRKWEKARRFLALWQAGLAEYDDMEGISCRRQSLDGARGKAPLAREAVGPNPTDRQKKGSKRHLLADAPGIPLSLVVTGPIAMTGTQGETVLAAWVIERPTGTSKNAQHLCADSAYAGAPARQAMVARNDTPQVRPRAAEASPEKEGSQVPCPPRGRRGWPLRVQPFPENLSQG